MNFQLLPQLLARNELPREDTPTFTIDHTPDTTPTLEPLGLSPEELLEWTFMLDVLNFCFWSDEATLFTFSYGGVRWTGYRSMLAALVKAVEDGIPVYRPSYYVNISEDELGRIFRSDTHVMLPLISSRRENLIEAAQVLNKVGQIL
jgi:hypothetical protein